MSAKRGTTAGSIGWKFAFPGMGPLAEMNRVQSRRTDVVPPAPQPPELAIQTAGRASAGLVQWEANLKETVKFNESRS